MKKNYYLTIFFITLSLMLGAVGISKIYDAHSAENAKKASPRPSSDTNPNDGLIKLTTKTLDGFTAKIPAYLSSKVKIKAINGRIPHLNTDIVNLTKGAAAYRLFPTGTKFKELISIEINYDKAKIPEGYSEKDIQIFKYNKTKKYWEKLPKSQINEEALKVYGSTNVSSDFIAGIIKQPESPDTSGFTPTSISEIKATSPFIGVQPIAPVSAGNDGAASTSFSIEIPSGRGGMQPSIQIQYSNEGGFSWLGTGWNISLPSVNIDTRWGVPRYDSNLETESYTLAGEDLLPNAHRSEWEARTADKIFYPRSEGAFNKITRKGNSPKSYQWEVNTKSGVSFNYGDNENTVLQDSNGNIGCWALTQQKDLKGNTVSYEYTKENGVLYPKAIYYTGKNGNKGAYSVQFISEKRAEDEEVQILGRLGFRQEYNRILKRIEVKYLDKLVRAYEFKYIKGQFNKTLLAEIKTLDADNNLFYSNKLEYYNDVKDGLFAEQKKWNVPDNHIESTFLGIKGFSGNPTLAGSSKSTSKGVNFRVGVGIIGVGRFNNNTVGAGGGSNWGETVSKVMLQDIDGDNLPDKVFLKGKAIYYAKNLSNQGQEGFGKEVLVSGINSLGETKSSSYNYGVDLIAKFKGNIGLNIGYNKQVSKTETKSYFMDFNGDGLDDFVNKGLVYFNRLDKDGIPNFEPSSSGTPSPIITNTDKKLEDGLTSIDKEELMKNNPLHDAVRIWKAPADGTISVKHTYQLQKDTTAERLDYKKNDGTPKADGVKLYFQHKDKLIWEEEIKPDDYSLKTREPLDNISVKKDDILYFRVSSIKDGNFDQTLWNPEITYTDFGNSKDYNGLSLEKYTPGSDALYASEKPFIFDNDAAPALKGSFSKGTTTDKIKLKIIKRVVGDESYQATILAEKTFGPEAVPSFDLSGINIGKFSSGEGILFQIESDTEINWQTITLNPHVEFTNTRDSTEIRPVNVDFKIFEKVDSNYLPQLTAPSQKGKARLFINPLDQNKLLNAAGGEVLISAKQNGKPVAKKRYSISAGGIKEATRPEDAITDSISANNDLFVEVIFPNKELFKTFKDNNVQIVAQVKDSIKIPTSDPRYPTQKYEIITTEQLINNYASYLLFEAPNVENKFGKLFRGWGSFVLNGTKASETIDENLLVEPSDKPEIDENNQDPEKEKPESEHSNIYFIRTIPDFAKKRDLGLEDDIYISSSILSPSRLGENDLEEYLDTSLPVLNGGSSRALSMISESKSKVISAGANISAGGEDEGTGVGIGGSKATGTAEVIQTMNDLNGDQFPDFIRGGAVQFTNPLGGLSDQNLKIGSFSKSKTGQFGGSMNGGYAHGTAKSSLFYISSKAAAQANGVYTSGQKDTDKVKNSISISGNFSSGKENGEYAYTDINGDGLADLLTKSSVKYNLGYAFSPEEKIEGQADYSYSTSQDSGLGLGYSAYSGSFSGGVNFAKSESRLKIQYLDINGDGLADKLIYKGNDLEVFLNIGNKFYSQPVLVPVTGDLGKNASISYGGGINASFSFPIFITNRMSITAGGSYGINNSRVESTFTDINGDGYLDLVFSEGEDDLRVALSKIGRTNMLKTIHNATGSTMDINYQFVPPTYASPNARWVLKEVKINDGFPGDGVDEQITRYKFENPYYDRRERLFYGFENVEQSLIHPATGETLRTSVQKFYNRDYFRKSILKTAYTLDKKGKRLNESFIKYAIKEVRHTAGSTRLQDLAENKLLLPATDASSIFVAPIEETTRSYEGADYLEKKIEKSYDNNGNVSRYTDYGNGTEASKLTADITYHESQNPYFGGIPAGIVVKDQSGVVRKRTAEINGAAEVTAIHQFYQENQSADTYLEYDEYGNVSRVTAPENNSGEKASITYSYDDDTHSHLTAIKDQFGYQNTTAYDYRFNTPVKTTDRNGESISYSLDTKGRTIAILAPKEAKAGKTYTIKYEYPDLVQPKSQPPFAVTKNYDAEHDKDIETYTYADGTGRVVQIKKTASVFKGKNQADEEKHIVSGKQVYDALGRVIEAYYPTTSAISTELSAAASSQKPTTTVYDEKDRVIEQTLPDGSTSTSKYQIGDIDGAKQLATTLTDALGRKSTVYTDVRGLQTKTVQPTGIETQFEYSALGEILKVTDADGHSTISQYDLLGRRTKLTHPDAGTTILKYDKAGNITHRQTSQIRDIMPDGWIQYLYDYSRLREIRYPKNPENNVRYHYGKQEDAPGRRGRVWLVEDASGGTEFFYGDMGEVTKEIRSIRISPVEVHTYITQYQYDSWNRIQTMVYPDGEVLDYGYNRAGMLTSLTGKKQQGNTQLQNTYNYIARQGYDEFEQKVYRKLGNGTETSYTYDPAMRRLSQLDVAAQAQAGGTRKIMENAYAYDAVGNILSVENTAPAASFSLGGSSRYDYQYDDLNRLTAAKGRFAGDQAAAEYSLGMAYNKMNAITRKNLAHSINGKEKGYQLQYQYNDQGHPNAPSKIVETLPGSPAPSSINYQYDGNGNPVYYDEYKSFRGMTWDEENRLRGINDNGKLNIYTYDYKGERAVKSSGEMNMVVINGATSAVISHTDNFTAYVNPYFVIQKGRFTKHYFEAGSRVASKLGEGTFHQPARITAGGIDYVAQAGAQQAAINQYIKDLQVPPGPPTQQGIYATPEWTGQPYPDIDWQDVAQNQEPPEGWPRFPRFNEKGDVPGPPVQFGGPVKPETAPAGLGFLPNGQEEKNIYYYHPDHLGSANYITDARGRISQHTEYIAFGETLYDEHSVDVQMPYLFNGKELDDETGYYYYGARYYNPKTSLWLNIDPLAEKRPSFSPYVYTLNNPINLIDPTGLIDEDPPGKKGGVRFVLNIGDSADLQDAARTRMKEIRKNYPNDKLVEITDGNLGNLSKNVAKELKAARKEGYGKTFEVSVFSHASTDGPVGSYDSNNPYDLSKESGNPMDKGQMSVEGWSKINWNFDPSNSVAAFYGCQSDAFAEKFMNISNPFYTAGIGGRAGGTETISGQFDGTILNFVIPNSNVYLRSQTDGKVDPLTVYRRGYTEKIGDRRYLRPIEYYRNATVPSK